MSLQSTLNDLGLKKSKAIVYMAALSIGSGSAVDIATKSKLPRTTTIEVLETLVVMGLVSYVMKGRAKIYTVEPPEKLKTLLREKERSLQAIMPELRSLVSTKGKRPTIRVYEGIEGIKTVLEDTLNVQEKQLCGILSMADLYQIPGKTFMDSYVQRRISAGIHLRVIRSEGKEVEETWPTSERENRELRYASGGMIFPMTYYVYDGKVSIIGTDKENFGMIIESDDYYQTQKNLFELLWEVSKVGKKIN